MLAGASEELSFLFNGLPTLETAQPEVGSNGRKSTARHVVSGAPLRPLKIWRTECRPCPVILIIASGLQVPNPPAAGALLELLPRRERVAACRPGDGLGTAPSGAFPGRRTVDSELCSECQSEEIQPSTGKWRE
ncbi:hypothetical protein V6N13_040330 [Hibiscus sabdariffa]